MDCEDSVAAVDAEDKVVAYRNWLGLMKGDLTAEVTRAGGPSPAGSIPTATTSAPTAATFAVRCRALMLVRNVGHLMTTPAILDARRQRGARGVWTR